jgi:hypothetical protein
VKNKAKERLRELVDPALAALHKVLSDKDADDSVKVRAALGILDRTGFGPGVDINIGVSKFDSIFDGITEVDLDRSLPDAGTRPAVGGGGRDPMPLGYEDVEQAVVTAHEDEWRASGYDAEDAPPDHPYRDENTVTGEVIQSRYESGPLPDPRAHPMRPTEFGGGPVSQGRYDVPRDVGSESPPRYDPEADV